MLLLVRESTGCQCGWGAARPTLGAVAGVGPQTSDHGEPDCVADLPKPRDLAKLPHEATQRQGAEEGSLAAQLDGTVVGHWIFLVLQALRSIPSALPPRAVFGM